MDDNTRAVAETMIALASREMDYSQVRAVHVRLDLPAGPSLELTVESTLALDEADAGPTAAAVFTAAAPATPAAAPATPAAVPAAPAAVPAAPEAAPATPAAAPATPAAAPAAPAAAPAAPAADPVGPEAAA